MSIVSHTKRVQNIENDFEDNLYFKLSSPQKISKKANRAWSLPAGPAYACPGATEACEGCYAMKGRHAFRNVQNAFLRNWLQLKFYEQTDSVKKAAQEIEELLPKRAPHIFRIHESGDFHSQFAVRVWAEVVKNNPHIQFWTYTRSFHLDFTALVSLPNFRLWASTDRFNETKAIEFVTRYQVHNVLHAYGPWQHGVDKPENSFYCPATMMDDNGRPRLETTGACEKCKLCFNQKVIKNVVFLEH